MTTLFFLNVSGLAWIIIPQTIGHRSEHFTYKSWQIFLALCSIPSFIVAVLLLYLPESPKFLITQNEHDEALKVFKKIYTTNTGKDEATYPVSGFVNVIPSNNLKKTVRTLRRGIQRNEEAKFFVLESSSPFGWALKAPALRCFFSLEVIFFY